MPQDLDNLLKSIQEYEGAAKELAGNMRILAQWELQGGDVDKVTTLLADAVTQSKSLSLLQERILEELSHL